MDILGSDRFDNAESTDARDHGRCPPDTPWKEKDRLAALARYAILNTGREPAFDDIIQLALDVFDTPIALISLVDKDRLWLKAEIGLGIDETPRATSISTYALLHRGVFVVENVQADPRFAAHPMVVGEPGLGFYAGALLETPEGLPLGTLCVLDTKPRPEGINDRQRRILETLARQVMAQLELRRESAERRLIEAALLEKERQLSTLVDNLPGIAYRCETKAPWSMSYVSEGIEALTGYAAADFEQGKLTWADVIHPEDLPEVQRQVRAATSARRMFSQAYRIIHRSGDTRWVLEHGQAVYGAESTPRFLEGFIGDITERKLAEEQLRESEEELRLVQEVANIGSYHTDAPGRSVGSREFYEQLGLPADTPYLDFADLLKLVHPEDRVRFERGVLAAIASANDFTCDYRIIRADTGEIRWIASQSRMLRDGEGRLIRSVGAHLDITDRKRSEEALRESENRLSTVFSQAIVGILQRDLQGHVLIANARFLEIVGRTADELSGLPLGALTHPDDFAANARLYEQAKKGEPAFFESRYIQPDGSVVWCELSISFVRNAAGQPESVITVAQDITARKRAEQERQRSADMFQMALQGAGAGTWDLDLSDYSLRLSPEAVRIYGLRDDHCGLVSNEEWLSLVHPDDAVRALVSGTEFSESLHSPAIEFRVRGGDGKIRWLRTLGHIIRDAEDKPIRMVGLIFDDTERKNAEQALQASEEHLRLVQEAAHIGSYECDAEKRSICSKQFYRNLGLDEDTPYMDFESYMACVHPEDRERLIREGDAAANSSADGFDADVRIVRADNGEVRWMYSRTSFERDSEGRVVRAVGAHMDITERKHAETAMREREALNLSITEASADCIVLLDIAGNMLFMNGPGLRMTEFDDFSPLVGQPWVDYWPVPMRETMMAAMNEARGGGVGRFATRNATAKGTDKWWDVVVTPVLDERGQPTHLLTIARDVTEQHRNEQRILWTASHDALTKLPNRHYFQNKLSEVLIHAASSRTHVGLFVFDLDQFKDVNDSLGHDAGDALLKTFAERLRSKVPDGGIIARIGGDEFALILPDLGGDCDLATLATPIVDSLREPFVYKGRTLDCRASVGAAVFPEQGSDPDELVKNADLALYSAKIEKRGSMMVFTPNMRWEMQNRLSMTNLARLALDGDLIRPFYQPKIELNSGRVAGFEALLRWQHARLGIQSPASISAAFEDLDLAYEIGERMQMKVFADMRRWLDAGLDFGHVAINTSAAEFRHDDFAEALLGRMEAAGIPATHLELEVTEQMFLGKGVEYVERALTLLSQKGIRIALDDFGTGYSSLSHLKQFPVDVLKIDQSFIRDLEKEEDDAEIVRAVLNLGHSLRIAVVAEGIETVGQADYVWSQGCQFGQGHLFGKAVAGVTVPRLLKRWSPDKHWKAQPTPRSTIGKWANGTLMRLNGTRGRLPL